jgi:hypothetical protein
MKDLSTIASDAYFAPNPKSRDNPADVQRVPIASRLTG